MPDSLFETRQIRYRFSSRSSCGKVSQATQDKWRRLKKLFAKRHQSSKFPSLMLTRSLQLLKYFNSTTWHHEVPHLCCDNCAADCKCGLPDCGAFASYPSAQEKENNGASIKKRQVDAEQR